MEAVKPLYHTPHEKMLDSIKRADALLTERFKRKLVVNGHLDRTLVSFQANKNQSGQRRCTAWKTSKR